MTSDPADPASATDASAPESAVRSAPDSGDDPRPAWQLSGFGDEIDADPEIQIAVLQALGANHLELRSAWGTNVVDLDDDQLDRLAAVLEGRGMAVSAVASPIGKVDVSEPIEAELTRLDAAMSVAQRLGTRYIRIFSFYRAAGLTPEDVRDQVISHLRVLAEAAERQQMILLHENEKGIYGDTPERVLDLITSVDSPALKVAWDNANFVQVGVAPMSRAYPLLRDHLVYLQVKDARFADGTVVPAGEGDGELAETVAALHRDGYTGFASLEPHLSLGHELGGFSGPAQFGRAARAFRTLTDAAGVDLV